MAQTGVSWNLEQLRLGKSKTLSNASTPNSVGLWSSKPTPQRQKASCESCLTASFYRKMWVTHIYSREQMRVNTMIIISEVHEPHLSKKSVSRWTLLRCECCDRGRACTLGGGVIDKLNAIAALKRQTLQACQMDESTDHYVRLLENPYANWIGIGDTRRLVLRCTWQLTKTQPPLVQYGKLFN